MSLPDKFQAYSEDVWSFLYGDLCKSSIGTKLYDLGSKYLFNLDCGYESISSKGFISAGYYLGEACRVVYLKSNQGQTLSSLRPALDTIGIHILIQTA